MEWDHSQRVKRSHDWGANAVVALRATTIWHSTSMASGASATGLLSI